MSGPDSVSHEVEPHHVPHGYVYPKEHHHWWWYAGFVVGAIVIILIIMAFRQFDAAEGPICSRDLTRSLTSSDGTLELSLAHASCFGGEEQQRLMIRRIDQGSGRLHTLMTFDDKANIRATWVSDRTVVVTQRGGSIETFEPLWHDVRIRYRK